MDAPEPSHEYIFLLTKSARYYYDAEAVKEKAESCSMRNGFRGGDGTRYVNNRSFDNDAAAITGGGSIEGTGTRNRRSVWTVATQPYKGAHFATFPPKLIEPCILAGTSAAGCCPTCGTPWERVVKKDAQYDGDTGGFGDKGSKWVAEDSQSSGHRIQRNMNILRAQGRDHDNPFPVKRTVGWRPTCACYAPVYANLGYDWDTPGFTFPDGAECDRAAWL
ncbi:MAG: site-specific DNA-methyltransferase, partial [Verrucomicrobia bacterium]|nr:site-specific DNA-methyltransferase [Verrucomicrobiota bacterium]